ncbi:MAG: tryptophan synthase subunit alpha [Nitrospiraceae bacterium]
MSRLEVRFRSLAAKREQALITYIMAGDPSLSDTEALVLALEQAGADVIELGVPFSDPIADGPVIQQAADRALKSGTTLKKILAMTTGLRTKTQIPLVLMAYYNTIYAYGEAAFCRDAVVAGIDGLIVPDMPVEESGPLNALATPAGLDLIFLLAPTSTASRRTMVARASHGFVYYVSLTGITGAKLTDMGDVEQNLNKIRKVSKVPVSVGFGVATPDDVKRLAKTADGVIVGSALVKRIAELPHNPTALTSIADFVRSLKAPTCANAPAHPQ